jgi:hypothetical protein
MIRGAHAIIYSTDADADRVFLRDVLRLSHVDVGGGWLIFSLPPSELAVHPFDANDRHELFFLVNDVEKFVAEMRRHEIACTALREEDWGRVTEMTLPGGGKVGVYEPRHASPPSSARAPHAKSQRASTARPRAKTQARKRRA